MSERSLGATRRPRPLPKSGGTLYISKSGPKNDKHIRPALRCLSRSECSVVTKKLTCAKQLQLTLEAALPLMALGRNPSPCPSAAQCPPGALCYRFSGSLQGLFAFFLFWLGRECHADLKHWTFISHTSRFACVRQKHPQEATREPRQSRQSTPGRKSTRIWRKQLQVRKFFCRTSSRLHEP